MLLTIDHCFSALAAAQASYLRHSCWLSCAWCGCGRRRYSSSGSTTTTRPPTRPSPASSTLGLTRSVPASAVTDTRLWGLAQPHHESFKRCKFNIFPKVFDRLGGPILVWGGKQNGRDFETAGTELIGAMTIIYFAAFQYVRSTRCCSSRRSRRTSRGG